LVINTRIKAFDDVLKWAIELKFSVFKFFDRKRQQIENSHPPCKALSYFLHQEKVLRAGQDILAVSPALIYFNLNVRK